MRVATEPEDKDAFQRAKRHCSEVIKRREAVWKEEQPATPGPEQLEAANSSATLSTLIQLSRYDEKMVPEVLRLVRDFSVLEEQARENTQTSAEAHVLHMEEERAKLRPEYEADSYGDSEVSLEWNHCPSPWDDDHHLRPACPKKRSSPNIWQREYGQFRGKLYRYTVPNKTAKSPTRRINLWKNLAIMFPDELDLGADGQDCFLSIEACAEHLRHPECYAMDAREDDICKCLSFKITGQRLNGQLFDFVPRVRGPKAVFRANSFADILLHGKDLHEIAKTARRYLYFKRKEHAPEGLEEFIGGSYTSDV